MEGINPVRERIGYLGMILAVGVILYLGMNLQSGRVPTEGETKFVVGGLLLGTTLMTVRDPRGILLPVVVSFLLLGLSGPGGWILVMLGISYLLALFIDPLLQSVTRKQRIIKGKGD